MNKQTNNNKSESKEKKLLTNGAHSAHKMPNKFRSKCRSKSQSQYDMENPSTRHRYQSRENKSFKCNLCTIVCERVCAIHIFSMLTIEWHASNDRRNNRMHSHCRSVVRLFGWQCNEQHSNGVYYEIVCGHCSTIIAFRSTLTHI